MDKKKRSKNNEAESQTTLENIALSTKKPTLPLMPHNPLAFYQDAASYMSLDAVHHGMYNREELAAKLETEAALRGVAAKTGEIPDINKDLQKMGQQTQGVIASILLGVQRTRGDPGISMDCYLRHEWCDDLCKILFSSAEDRDLALREFAQRLIVWYPRLVAIEEDEVETLQPDEKAPKASIEDVESDVEFLLG